MCTISCFDVKTYMIPVFSIYSESFKKQIMFIRIPSTNIHFLFFDNLFLFFNFLIIHFLIFIIIIFIKVCFITLRTKITINVINSLTLSIRFFRWHLLHITTHTRFLWSLFYRTKMVKLHPFILIFLLTFTYVILIEFICEDIIIIQKLFIKCILLSLI